MDRLGRLSLLAFFICILSTSASAGPVATLGTCPGGSTYDVTLQGRDHFGWPFYRDCGFDVFSKWFKNHQDHWLRHALYFDDLNPQLAQVHLENETLKANALVFDFDDDDLNHLKVSMNGFGGVALNKDAISIQVLKNYSFVEKKDRDDRDRRHRVHSVKLIQVTVHLEDFIFKINKTAADILRNAALGKGTVEFRIRDRHHFLRLFDGQLRLQGTLPGPCPTPTPASTPVPTPVPIATPIPAPVVTINSTSVGLLTHINSVQIAFSANEPSSFVCSLDTATYSACTPPFSQSSLADGAHNFSVEAINSQGTVSLPAHFGWTVDTTPPVVTFGVITPSSSLTGQTQITVNFSANETATFTCSLDNGGQAPCSSPDTINNLTNGPHIFSVQATDLAENVGAAISYSWTVKLNPPKVTITGSVPSANPSNLTSRAISFTGSSDTVSFVCSLDNQSPAPCTSPDQLGGLSDGAHQFSVWAIDAVGNQSAPAVASFTIDTISPTILISSTVPSQSPTNQTVMQIAFSADESSTFMCTLDNGGSSFCVSPINFSGLVNGTHTFSVTAIDVAGNISSPGTYSWVVDTVPPVLTLTSVNPSYAITSQTQITLTFTANEAVTMACALDSSVAQDCSTGTVTYSGLSNGSHTVTIMATDVAGNVSQALVYNFTVDTTIPVVQISSVVPSQAVTNQTAISFTFTASEAVTFQCQLDGAGYSTCASPQSYSGLANGTHAFSVQSINGAGTLSPSPATYSWTINTIPPTTTITSQNPSQSFTSTETFGFASSESGSTFDCTLDGVGPAGCSSPITYNGLADGLHTFTVNATDPAGNRDPVGAAFTWSINTQPLTISNFQISKLTQASATVTWTTNLPATSQVFYALYSTTNYSSVTDNTMTTTHSITITGLTNFTLYSAYGSSTGADGTTVSSPTPPATFRTLF